MTTFKKLSAMTLALALALCLVFAFTSCGPVAQECQHADANNDHLCDNCSEALTECADADADHLCDICGKTGFGGECADADKDHDCDYCGEKISECNENDSHKCDTCGKVSGECADDDKDHYCDLCYAELTDCADRDNDHKCDVCGDVKSTCEQTDADKNHVCDLCGKAVGEHADSDPMADGHICDYCGKSLCEDGEDEGHNCDVCQANLCVDADKNCACDVCEAVLCVDVNPIDHNCDVCGKVFSECADGEDGNHDCDICYKSLCADGEDEDHKCDVCGAILCVDADNNHACDNCGKTICVDGADRDHKCDVCGILFACVDANADHYCDGCGVLVCAEGCTEHVAYAVIVYVEGSNCTLGNGAKVAYFAAGDDYSVVPSYTADQYIIDLWVVYDGNGTKIAYIENGDAYVATAAGTYYIAPIFIANKTDSIFDTEGSLDVSDGTKNLIDESSVLPEWADVDASQKLVILGQASGQYPNQILNVSTAAQSYLTTDPTDAANIVLMVATRSGGTYSVGSTVISTPFDASSKGDGYLVTFDYFLDQNCNTGSDFTIFPVIKDSKGNAFKIGVIVPTKNSMPPANGDTATPTESAFRFQSRHYNTKDTAATPAATSITGIDGGIYKDSAGSEKVLLNSDTWYTFQFRIEYNKITSYWSLRGSNEFTRVQEYDFSNFSISEIGLVSFEIQHNIYQSQALCYYDNVWFGRGHDCVDADNNHNCDTCEKALCYDGIDADHKCDRCDAVLCYEGEIADHKCDVCAATLSECADENKNHYCDICGKGGFGGDCADADVNADGHNCNYCGKNLCVDADKNHACEICNGLVGGECADANKDHNCDYCGARKFGSIEGSTDCEDAIELEDGTIKKDHKCNYCGAEMNMDQHVDAEGDNDHVCDYGCGETLTECKDNDGDYACDECKKLLCDDLNKDHKCDITAEHECVWVVTPCVDADKNHDCDFTGCDAVVGVCADSETDEDHDCDYGCGKVWNECVDTDKNHLCDVCSAIVSYCADADADHKCDACGKEGVCADADKNNICDNCGKVVAYNFETDKIESKEGFTILSTVSNVNRLSNFTAEQIAAATTSTTTLTTATRPEGYNYATWLSLGVDPTNATNQVLSFQTTRVEGGGGNAPSYVTATPVLLDAEGNYTVMKFRMYIGTVSGSAKAYHDVLYLYMIDENGTSKKATVGYRTSTASTDENGNTTYALKSCGGSTTASTDMWVDMILVNDNNAKEYYAYYSVDGGNTYTNIVFAKETDNDTKLKGNISQIKFEANAYQVNSLAFVDDWSNVRVSSVSIPLTDGTVKEYAAPAVAE